MNDGVQNYIMTYSFTKLEETARTFRRLGEACENISDFRKSGGGISKQLFLVANVIDECTMMDMHTEKIDKECERELIRRCGQYGVKIKNPGYIVKSNGSKSIVFTAKASVRKCLAAKKIIPAISSAMGCGFCQDESNTRIINNKYHQYVFNRVDRFRILSGVARVNRDKNIINGDNFMVSQLDCGKTIAAIADGMGSGTRACAESRMVIELMENCIDAGFDEKEAIELINLAYISACSDNKNLNFDNKESNPVTIDICVINNQSAVINFIKSGAAATFIKREKCSEIIKSTTLPIGVFEKVDYDCTVRKLYDGDYVIMVSDGILDNIPGTEKENVLAKIINSIQVRQPKAMADEILKKTLRLHDNKPSDDGTVLVLGLFDTQEK